MANVYKSIMRLKPYQYRIIVTIFYLLISYLYIRVFSNSGFLYSGDDLAFHLNRIEEIYRGIIHKSYIPNISIYTFNNIGDGVQFFYPWLSIYSFALIKLVIHDPIKSIYIGIWFGTFLTLMIAHFSMNKFCHLRIQSMLFSVIYTFSMYRSANTFYRFDLGEFLAIIFLPLVFLGIHYSIFGDYKKWYYLAIGMTSILYSHVLSFLIILLFIFLVILISINHINAKWIRIKYLLFAGLCTALMTSTFWIPFLEQYISINGVNEPAKIDLFTNTLKINDVINTSFSNSFWPPNLGVLLIIALLFGWTAFRYMNKTYISIYLFGILTLLLSSNLVPWKIVQNTPLDTLQFPWRLIILTNILFAAFFSHFCIVIFQRKNIIVTLSLLLLPIIFYYSSAQSFIQSVDQQENLNFKPGPNHSIYPYKVSSKTYKNQFHYYWTSGQIDYFPKKSIPYADEIIKHKIRINGIYSGDIVIPSVVDNSITFNLSSLDLKKNDTIDLPFLAYKNNQVRINNYISEYSISERGTIKVKVVNSHNMKIIIKYIPSMVEKLSIWISLLSILGVFLLIIYRDRIKLFVK